MNGLQKVPINASYSASVTSEVIHLDEISAASVQLLANQGSGNIAGQWMLEGSNDYSDGSYGLPRADGTWTNLDSSLEDSIAATSGAQNVLVRLGLIDFLYLRITFTRSSGTGPLKAVVGGKY
jgi:hypothetical protein